MEKVPYSHWGGVIMELKIEVLSPVNIGSGEYSQFRIMYTISFVYRIMMLYKKFAGGEAILDEFVNISKPGEGNKDRFRLKGF